MKCSLRVYLTTTSSNDVAVSDTCYQELAKDRSGPRLVELIQKSFNNAVVITSVLPDERDLIQRELRKWIDRDDVRVIITTGGTGFAPRDVTPEATKPLLDKDCPQLTLAIALASLQKTKFAALSRGLCGISGNTLILNFPGSEKAVAECFEVVREILPHAVNLICDNVPLVQRTHTEIQSTNPTQTIIKPLQRDHVCPHKTGAGNDVDRNSPFPMLPVEVALNTILSVVQQNKSIVQKLIEMGSPINIPPFRASIKDGYAMKSTGFSGTKRVIDCIAAGDKVNTSQFAVSHLKPTPNWYDKNKVYCRCISELGVGNGNLTVLTCLHMNFLADKPTSAAGG